MPWKLTNKDSLAGIVFILYLLPLLLLVIYSMASPAPNPWGIFSTGLLLTAVGTGAIYAVISSWQPPQKRVVNASQHPIIQDNEEELNQKNAEIYSLLQSQEQLSKETEQTIERLSYEIKTLEEQLVHKERLLEEAEQALAEIQATSERKQQRIHQLETKVRDLSYEIKTLLQLTDISEGEIQPKKTQMLQESPAPYSTEPTHPHPPVSVSHKAHSQDDATNQLKRCINIAQKMTGASLYSSGTSKLRGIPVDNFALDLRCLFDSLRSETSAPILFYSPKEDKLLFANEQVRELTGWSPDKFIQNFDHIVQEGKEEWRESLHHLSSRMQTKARIIIKSRTGEDHLIHALLGSIPTGIFRHYVMIIFYNANHPEELSSAI